MDPHGVIIHVKNRSVNRSLTKINTVGFIHLYIDDTIIDVSNKDPNKYIKEIQTCIDLLTLWCNYQRNDDNYQNLLSYSFRANGMKQSGYLNHGFRLNGTFSTLLKTIP